MSNIYGAKCDVCGDRTDTPRDDQWNEIGISLNGPPQGFVNDAVHVCVKPECQAKMAVVAVALLCKHAKKPVPKVDDIPSPRTRVDVGSGN